MIASSSTSAPSATATTGLRYATSVDRAAPTSTIRRKNSTNASAVQRAPSPTSARTASSGGHGCRPGGHHEREVHQRRDAEARGGQRDRRDVAQAAVRDDRRGRVAERGEQHLRDGPRVAAGRRPGPSSSATPPRPTSRPTQRTRATARRSPTNRPRTTAAIGTGGHEQPGGGAGQRALGVGQQDPRQDDLEHGEPEDRRPVPAEHAQAAAAAGRTAAGAARRAPVRTKTTVAGVTSPTATLMSRYGMPQMTPDRDQQDPAAAAHAGSGRRSDGVATTSMDPP